MEHSGSLSGLETGRAVETLFGCRGQSHTGEGDAEKWFLEVVAMIETLVPSVRCNTVEEKGEAHKGLLNQVMNYVMSGFLGN